MINIERRVYNMVVKHDTCNPFIIAKERNITVDIYALPSTIRACYTRILRRRHIGLSDKLSESGSTVALCHELGHDKLHYGGTFNCSIEPRQSIRSRPEFEANMFALHLLSYSKDFDLDIVKDFVRAKQLSNEKVHRLLRELVDYGMSY